MPRYSGVFTALVVTVAILNAPLARSRAAHSPHQSAFFGHSPAAAAPSLPLLFESAADSDAAFVARSRGYMIRVTSGGAFLRLPADVASRTVELEFDGARAGRLLPERDTETRINYLVGARDTWRTRVPAYQRVRVAGLYPGVDAIFYGTASNLEYDLIISPGASLDPVQMAYAGADSIYTDGATLGVTLGTSTLVQRDVNAYQDIDGRRVTVDAHYVVSHDRVRFAVGPYDHRRPLVLDPVITYSTYFGSTGNDGVRAMRTDGGSKLYVAGWADQGDFPASSLQPHSVSGAIAQPDGYIAKFEPDGSVDWLTFIGGSAEDEAFSLDIGGDGDIYVGGATRSSDFPTTAGSFHPGTPANGDQDVFVLRLSADGAMLHYSTCLGATQSGSGAGAAAIRVDTQGRAYFAGQTGSPAFPVTISASRGTSPPAADNRDAFVARLSPDGSTLDWSRLLAGSKWDTAAALDLDQYDNVYVAGSTTSDDFPAVNALFPQKSGPGDQAGLSGHDGFLARLEVTGHLDFSTYLGGTGEDDMYAVAQGEYGRIYVGGGTTSDGLTPFAKSSPAGQYSGIVFEIAPNGSSEIGARYVPAAGYTNVAAVTIGRDWSVWIAGESDGNGWPWADANGTDRFFQPAYGGGRSDISIQKWAPQLDELDYSALFGGSGDDAATAIASDPLTGDIYFGGASSSANYPTVNAVQDAPHGANTDGVIDRLACTITELDAVPTQPATGGSDATRSSADPWCFIAGTSDAPWLHVIGTSGTAVIFSTDPNSTTRARTGHITISGRTVVPITQAAGDGSSSGGTVDEIVLNATDADDVEGRWQEAPDSLHGTIMSEPDRGDPKLRAPLANPSDFFEFTFNADANKPYHLWIHGLAQNDSYTNDSAWVQFSDSVDGSGNPIWRVGSTDGTFVSLEPCSGCGEQRWGWRDNHYGGGLGPNVVFASSGTHTMRIQQREDGFSIGQVTLSAAKYLAMPPGADRNDRTVLQKPTGTRPIDEIVLWPAGGTGTLSGGDWTPVSDATAAGGERMWQPDSSAPKIATPAANPVNYFEITFDADANTPYHLWLRMKADNDSWQNDSVWVQFSGSVDGAGNATDHIGTTSGAWVSLEECSGCGDQGWGWQDNAYGSPGDLGPDIYFARSGPQTIRIQQREDGVSIDQIVLSAVKYATAAPGRAKGDATIVPRTQ
jgi:hypothetical protein